MSQEPLPLDTLHELAAGLLDESISPQGFAELNQLMLAHREAQQFFVRYVDLHATLSWTLASAQAPLARSWSESPAPTDPPSADAQPAARSALLGFLWGVVPGGEFVVGGLVLLAVCGAVWGVIHYIDGLRQDERLAHAPADRPLLKAGAEVGSLAVDAQARWTRQPAATAEKRARLGERYELADGRAEIVLERGTRIVIAAPAAWQLTSHERLELDHGQLLAHVPQAAVGFTVVTPTAEITDLGTDFSVVVDGDDVTQLAVSQGAVKLMPIEAQARPTTKAIRVTAGQAMRVARTADGGVVARQATLDRPLTETIARLNRPLEFKRRHVAFQASPAGSAGNTVVTDGNIGLDFKVSRPIRVYSLGVFDHLGDGIEPGSDLIVQLWSRDDHQTAEPRDDTGIAVLVEMVISSQTSSRLEGCHRFVDLPEPLDLAPGEYSLLAWGFSPENPGVDRGGANPPKTPQAVFDTDHFAIVPLAARAQRGVPPGKFPMFYSPDATRVIGGSFEFAAKDQE